MTDDGKPGSLLSAKQREFLEGGEVDPSYARTLRSRIRKRVRAGILDFPILLEHLSDRDRKLIIDEDSHSQKERIVLRRSIRRGVVFLYLLDPDGFERAVEDAIDAWFKKRGEVGSAAVSIEKEMIATVDEYEDAERGKYFGMVEEPGGLIPQYRESLAETSAEILMPAIEQMPEATRRSLLKQLQDVLSAEGESKEDASRRSLLKQLQDSLPDEGEETEE
jgi:hypothetical protein